MKRNLCVVLILCLLTIALTAGCASESEPSTSQLPTPKPIDFNSWTKSDWDSASAEQRLDAARFVLFELGSEYIEDFDDLAQNEKQSEFDHSAERVESAVSSYFESASDSDTLETFIQEGAGLVP